MERLSDPCAARSLRWDGAEGKVARSVEIRVSDPTNPVFLNYVVPFILHFGQWSSLVPQRVEERAGERLKPGLPQMTDPARILYPIHQEGHFFTPPQFDPYF
jgi:hypothetical protein